ncbi:MAG: response regulator [Candidatus Gygaella obscura]|nr:response regulator [Candidatus Gygaella obscura]
MGGKIEILIVDDEPVIRSLFQDLLTDEGYGVDSANNGQEAVDKVKEKKFDISFMDVHMPVMNGLEALIEMKKIQPDLMIVMTDSYPDKLVLESEKKGALTCIHKPFNIKEILDLIKNAIGKKEV